jgi:hypothetical protein
MLACLLFLSGKGREVDFLVCGWVLLVLLPCGLGSLVLSSPREVGVEGRNACGV